MSEETKVNTDRFGNILPFKSIPKETDCPADIIGKGCTLKKTFKDSKGVETNMEYVLDVCHIQRGRDEATSNKGFKYWGISQSPKDETSAEEFVAKFGEFFGYKYMAEKTIGAFNIENQKHCVTSIEKQWPEADLISTLANRAVKAESQLAFVKDIKTIAAELGKLTVGSPEYLAKLNELATASAKLLA